MFRLGVSLPYRVSLPQNYTYKSVLTVTSCNMSHVESNNNVVILKIKYRILLQRITNSLFATY